jgi:hypothetical protein
MSSSEVVSRTPNEKLTYNPADFNITLAICSIDTMANQTVADIVHLTSTGLIRCFCNTTSTLLPHARNNVVEQVYAVNPDFTHILFIDADQCGICKEYLEIMMAHNVDIIAGVTVTRNRGKDGKRKLTFLNKDKLIDLNKDLFEVRHTGFFFTLVRREVFDAIGEEMESGKKAWFRLEREIRKDYDPDSFIENQLAKLELGSINKEKVLRDCLKYGEGCRDGAQEIGEDVYFCHRAREAGFRCWIDTRLQIDHVCQERISVHDTVKEYK